MDIPSQSDGYDDLAEKSLEDLQRYLPRTYYEPPYAPQMAPTISSYGSISTEDFNAQAAQLNTPLWPPATAEVDNTGVSSTITHPAEMSWIPCEIIIPELRGRIQQLTTELDDLQFALEEGQNDNIQYHRHHHATMLQFAQVANRLREQQQAIQDQTRDFFLRTTDLLTILFSHFNQSPPTQNSLNLSIMLELQSLRSSIWAWNDKPCPPQ